MKPMTRLSAAALCAALMFSATACGGDDDKDTPKAKATPSATATPSETVPTTDPTPTANPTKAPEVGEGVVCRDTSNFEKFTGPAVVKFGEKQVKDAYCEIADFYYVNAVTNLTAPHEPEAKELNFAEEFMTPEAVSYWKKVTADAAKGNADAFNKVNGLTYWNLAPVEDLGYTFTDGEKFPRSVGGGVSTAQTFVDKLEDGRPVLNMSFTVTNNVVVLKGDKPFAIKVDRKVSVSLLQNPDKASDHDWLMYSWNNTWESNDPKPLQDVLKG